MRLLRKRVIVTGELMDDAEIVGTSSAPMTRMSVAVRFTDAHGDVDHDYITVVAHGRRAGTDVCQWAEACLLAEIESAIPGDARSAAALLGVTEPTLRRRQAERRHF